MKKTLTVNLGGIVFNIDEDAYQLLDNYFSNLRVHFKKEEGTDEIMDDFEVRTSELFSERLKMGFQVITIEHVEEVIKRMGKPEEIFEEGEEHQTKNNDAPDTAAIKDNTQTKKRLMRDPDDKILGGVASGLAHYMGIDPTIVRLILIALLLLPLPTPFSSIVVIYIILWMVVPVAYTAADKLMMRGESVNLENIGKTVTSSFEKVSNNVNEYIHSDKPRTTLQKIGDFIVSFFGILLKIFAVLLGLILIPVLLLVVFVLIVVIFALIGGGFGAIFAGIPFLGENFQVVTGELPEYIALIGSIGGLLFMGIPLIGLIYLLCGKFLNLSPMPVGAKWVMIILWFISMILCGITIYYCITAGIPYQYSIQPF
ncbi:MAG: PspC domain-containing protein [Tannerella sp.]|jgi:phage shock protein PspC (stress-responsive transcriptional regulator)|nr:PspC domain-containing protein [Tannerella sp.]